MTCILEFYINAKIVQYSKTHYIRNILTRVSTLAIEVYRYLGVLM